MNLGAKMGENKYSHVKIIDLSLNVNVNPKCNIREGLN